MIKRSLEKYHKGGYQKIEDILEIKKRFEDRRETESKRIPEIQSPFLRGMFRLTHLLERIGFVSFKDQYEMEKAEKGLVKYFSIWESMNITSSSPEKLQQMLETQMGLAKEEALRLNQKYDTLREHAQHGIESIKALDANTEATELFEQASEGAEAIVRLRTFEEEVLGMSRETGGEENFSQNMVSPR